MYFVKIYIEQIFEGHLNKLSYIKALQNQDFEYKNLEFLSFFPAILWEILTSKSCLRFHLTMTSKIPHQNNLNIECRQNIKELSWLGRQKKAYLKAEI